MTPADELRTAADKLRALATTASTDDDGTPTAHWNAQPCWNHLPDDGNRFLYGDRLTSDDGRPWSWPSLLHGGGQHRPARMRARHAEYAATMGPSVGLALADWLDAAAHSYECGVQAADDVFRDDPTGREKFLTTGPGAPSAEALAVARQILGTTP